jgi:Methyltransferase FkbM domain
MTGLKSYLHLMISVLLVITFMTLSTNSMHFLLSSIIHLDRSTSAIPGWKNIDIFYGIREKSPIYLSQANQSEAVVSMLNGKKKGFFVDLAANDAFFLSNSFYLEEMYDWSGLCIEANPLYWSSLSKRKCKVVAAAVGKTNMEEVRFRIDNEAFGGLIGEAFDNKVTTHKKKRRQRQIVAAMFTVRLDDIFLKFDVPHVIDYMSLDVEGAEELILADFPFRKYRFTIISIERPSDKLKAILYENGYEFVRQITWWGETFWIHSDERKNLNMSYFTDHYQNNYTEI